MRDVSSPGTRGGTVRRNSLKPSSWKRWARALLISFGLYSACPAFVFSAPILVRKLPVAVVIASSIAAFTAG